MGIFFRSFPSKKEAPATKKDAPAKPEPPERGKVTPHEYEHRAESQLRQKFRSYEMDKINLAVQGALQMTGRGENWRYKGLTADELDHATENLKKYGHFTEKQLKDVRE